MSWMDALAGCIGLALIAAVCAAFAEREPPAAPSPARLTPTTEPDVVAQRTAAYVEDEDGRPIARMSARLLRDASGVRIEYRAAATGADVVPPPGFEGVPGSNLTTAREIDALLTGGRIALRLEDLDRAAHMTVEAHAHRVDTVPLRTMGPDGRVDFDGSSAPLRVSLIGVSDVLRDGRYVLSVETDGQVRAQCRFVVRRGGGTILHLAGAPHPLQRDNDRDP